MLSWIRFWNRIRNLPLFFSIFSLVLLTTGCQAQSGAFQKMIYVVPDSLRVANFKGRLSEYSVVLPGIYRLNARGDFALRMPYSRETLTLLGSGRAVHPLISLTGARDGALMLSRQESRQRAIENIVKDWNRNSFDGVHIDFEFLPGKSGSDFRLFLSELRERKELSGKSISVAAFPPLWGTADEAAFFEPRTLHPLVDFVVYMMYDYHLHTPGPVTDIQWVQKNLVLIREEVPAGKIVLGMPAYGYQWERGKRRTLTEKQGQDLCQRYRCKRDASGMLKLIRSQSIAYIADARLRGELSRLAKEHNLAGTAIWRLGFEN